MSGNESTGKHSDGYSNKPSDQRGDLLGRKVGTLQEDQLLRGDEVSPFTGAASDADVHEELREALFDHLDEEGDTFSISVSEGVVTLGGSVRTDETRDLAERWASEIEGVVEVKNEIEVVPVTQVDNH